MKYTQYFILLEYYLNFRKYYILYIIYIYIFYDCRSVREEQGEESDEFILHFDGDFEVMEGGSESGFFQVYIACLEYTTKLRSVTTYLV